MIFPPIPASRRLATTIACLAGLWALFITDFLLMASRPPAAQHQEVHSVIAQSKLTPPVRSLDVSLRYSPDGTYLLLQDPTGVSVLLRNPLRILIHITTNNVYPVEFSPDSQSLTLVSRGLAYTKWKLPDGEKIAGGDLPSQDECSEGGLSPGGEFFACLKPDFHFVLFDMSTGKSSFEQSVAPPLPTLPGGLRSFHPADIFYFSSLDFDSAFSGPFGLIRTNEPRPGPNSRLLYSPIYFSPDAGTLLARLPKGWFGLDIASRKGFEPPGSVQKAIAAAAALQTRDRVIAIEKTKGSPPEHTGAILSLKDGEVLASLSLSAERLQMASNPRFVVAYSLSADGASAAAYDVEQSRHLDTPPAVALDIRGDEFAVYTPNGSIALYHVGERNLLANLSLPLPSLPLLRSASVTPNLDKLAFSIDGIGAIFDIPTGQRLVTFSKFSAANFLDKEEASLLFPRFYDDPMHVSRVDLSKGTDSPSWEVGKDEFMLHSAGPVLIHYSPLKGVSPGAGGLPELGMEPPYTIRALDPGTGKELWRREFKENRPIPFADPQGERLVLGWKAKSSGAKSAASHNPVARDLLKNSKVTEHDTYFEALDARGGNSVGGVLVMAGKGAASFDSALSAGNTLILQKDASRVSLYSLVDGQLKARLVGLRLSTAPDSQLLALDMGEGRLGIFDLSSGAKLGEKLFTEALSYTHFSADGKRLFVLTERQIAIILDVTNVRNPHVD